MNNYKREVPALLQPRPNRLKAWYHKLKSGQFSSYTDIILFVLVIITIAFMASYMASSI